MSEQVLADTSEDKEIRASGEFVIHSRPKDGPPAWRHKESGKVLPHAVVLARVRRKKERKRGGLET
jgi:hypothetical protein